MELAPAGVSLSFEVTFDRADLHVGMKVYDDSGSSPVLVDGPIAMALVSGYTYRAKFTPPFARSYIIIKSVYTSSGMTVLDGDYSQGSESIKAEFLNGASGCDVVGVIEANNDVIGLVDNNNTVVGLVEC